MRGIGPKTAAELLQRYGSLERLYANLQDLRRSPLRGARSTAAKLEQHVAMAGLSKQLATVSIDAPLKVSLRRLAYRGMEEPRLKELFAQLGFKTLSARVTGQRRQPSK